KNTRKFLSLNNFIASRPIIDASEAFSLSLTFTGGVLGNTKLNNPRTNEAIDAIRKVFFRNPAATPSDESHLNKNEIESPATTHPMVPHTLINEKSFSGLFICLNEIEFTKASVGIYKII